MTPPDPIDVWGIEPFEVGNLRCIAAFVRVPKPPMLTVREVVARALRAVVERYRRTVYYVDGVQWADEGSQFSVSVTCRTGIQDPDEAQGMETFLVGPNAVFREKQMVLFPYRPVE